MESNNTQVIINKLTEIKSQQDRIEQKLNTLLKKDNANNCKKSYKDYSAKEVYELRQRTSNIILGGLLLWHSQMKKCHKEPLTKSAISEVYAGMHARKGTTVTSLPVPYGNYGNLMRIILYHCTKDVVWIKTLPESQPALGIQSMRDRMIDEANLDFEQSQTYLDRASSLERLKSELPMTQSTPIQALSLPTTANTTIRTALPKFMKHLKIFMVTVILLIVLLKLMESMKKFLSKVARINLSLLIN